jgi:putative tricarboxylic transport membrane protein
LQEQGVAEVDTSNWTALFAPKGTPEAIVNKLNADVLKALQASDVKERFAAGGVEVIPSTPAELSARMKSELAIFRTVVAKSGMQQE